MVLHACLQSAEHLQPRVCWHSVYVFEVETWAAADVAGLCGLGLKIAVLALAQELCWEQGQQLQQTQLPLQLLLSQLHGLH
jgi:hypothetical protein